MHKVVIDTNVLISALIGSSYPTQIVFDLVLGKKVTVCSSAEIFKEYLEVLYRKKFIKYPGFVTKAEIVLSKIDEFSIKFTPGTKLKVIKDEYFGKF
jgi:putative PIN family toxin of toxin-antitoxin system